LGIFATRTVYLNFRPKNQFSVAVYRFGCKKASKFVILLMQISKSKSMDLELSKTVLGMFLRPLVTILCLIEVLEIGPKKEGGLVKKKTSQFLILANICTHRVFQDICPVFLELYRNM